MSFSDRGKSSGADPAAERPVLRDDAIMEPIKLEDGIADVHPLKKLTPSNLLLYRSLKYKGGYFSKMGKLAPDGSFHYDDCRLAAENGISVQTVRRSKRALRKHGKIRFEPGKYEGSATRYWMLPEGDKKSCSRTPQEGDILAREDDKSSPRAFQNVTPNRIYNRINKSSHKTDALFSEEQSREIKIQVAQTMGHSLFSEANKVITEELLERVTKQARIAKIDNLFAYAMQAAKNLKEERNNGRS